MILLLSWSISQCYFLKNILLVFRYYKARTRNKSGDASPSRSHTHDMTCSHSACGSPRGGENIGRRFLASSSAQKGTKDVICDREGVGDRWSTDGASNTFRTHSSPHSLYPLANQEKSGGHQRENYKETVKG